MAYHEKHLIVIPKKDQKEFYHKTHSCKFSTTKGYYNFQLILVIHHWNNFHKQLSFVTYHDNTNSLVKYHVYIYIKKIKSK
jgi:hypothetical protein